MAELKTDQMGDDIDELKQDISDLVGEKMDINAKLKERDANKQLVLRLQSKERLEMKETYTEIAQRLARLLQNSNEIFRKIKDLLLKDCKSGIPPAEIEEMCESYRYLFLLLESLFHYIQNQMSHLHLMIRRIFKEWCCLP